MTRLRPYALPVFMFAAGIAVGAIAAGRLDGPIRAGGTAPTGAPDPAAGPPTAQEAVPPGALAVTAAATDPERGGQAPDLAARLEAMDAAWGEIRTEMARLRQRVDALARQIARTEQAAAPAPSRPWGPEDRGSALVQAGVPEERAADLVWRQGQQELDHLELRDIATREGWFGTDRYREELGRIQAEAVDLRREIGDDAYDRYMYASGADNRVQIVGIIPGSMAEGVGLLAGDIVESYAGTRVFRLDELQGATVEGERGELVPFRVRRGGSLVEIWLPRGPLGVRLDRASVDPDA